MRTHAHQASTLRATRKHKASLGRLVLIRYPGSMTLGSRIAAYRKARGWTQATLASLVNVAQTTISKWERGGSEPTRDEKLRLLAALQINYSDLEPLAALQKRRKVPLMGYVGAGQALDFSTSSGLLEQIDCPIDVPEGAIALRVRGDSMRPLLKSGAVLIFWREGLDPADFLGELCVAHIENGGAFVKYVERGSAPNTWTLTSLNAEPIRDVQLSKIYIVDVMLPSGF